MTFFSLCVSKWERITRKMNCFRWKTKREKVPRRERRRKRQEKFNKKTFISKRGSEEIFCEINNKLLEFLCCWSLLSIAFSSMSLIFPFHDLLFKVHAMKDSFFLPFLCAFEMEISLLPIFIGQKVFTESNRERRFFLSSQKKVSLLFTSEEKEKEKLYLPLNELWFKRKLAEH